MMKKILIGISLFFLLVSCAGVSVEKKTKNLADIKTMLSQELDSDPENDGFEYTEIATTPKSELISKVIYEKNDQVMFMQKKLKDNNEKLITVQYKDGENFYVSKDKKMKKAEETKLNTTIEEISAHLVETIERYEEDFVESQEESYIVWTTPVEIQGTNDVIYKTLTVRYNEHENKVSTQLENEEKTEKLTYIFSFKKEQSIQEALDELVEKGFLIEHRKSE